MEKTASMLIEVIHKLIRHHEELLVIEREKVSSVIQQDWKGLERLVGHSRKILKAVAEVEKVRLGIVKALGGSAESTLTEIVSSLPAGRLSEEEGRKVLDSGERLRELIIEIQDLGRRTEALIQSSLEVVNFSISLFSGAAAGGKTYSVNGSEQNLGENRTSLVFDVKA